MSWQLQLRRNTAALLGTFTGAVGEVNVDTTNNRLVVGDGATLGGWYVGNQIQVLAATYTLTSQTAAQKLFNATAAGAITLALGTFEFECAFSLTSMSATSGTFGFALGGGATFTQMWISNAVMGTPVATPATSQSSFNTAANVGLTSNSTATTGYARITGILRVTVAGTVIPQVSLTTAAAAVVAANSYFKVAVLGAPSTVVSVGPWS